MEKEGKRERGESVKWKKGEGKDREDYEGDYKRKESRGEKMEKRGQRYVDERQVRGRWVGQHSIRTPSRRIMRKMGKGEERRTGGTEVSGGKKGNREGREDGTNSWVL